MISTAKSLRLDGTELTARCMLHETDHCDGIVFLDKMSRSNARS